MRGQHTESLVADGKALGKRVVLEEFGVAVDAVRGVADEAARTAGYTAWTGAVLDGGGAGDRFWILTSRVDDGSFYPDYDGYRVVWNADPGKPTHAPAALFAAHAKSDGVRRMSRCAPARGSRAGGSRPPRPGRREE